MTSKAKKSSTSIAGSVALVFGTRPEAVKLAPVARALEKLKNALPVSLVVTAQHRELLDQMLAVFDLQPQVDLDLMRANQTLTDFGARALKKLGSLFRKERPAMVLVQGDTSTVFFAALAAFYEGIPVGHVEAGLRTGDMAHPFPEEANRSLTGRLATLHFAPTDQARDHLLAEGIDSERILVTGNPVVDSLKYIRRILGKRKIESSLKSVLSRRRKRVAITIHRRENFGEPLRGIFGGIGQLAQIYPKVDFIYPVHPNPNVLKPAREQLGSLHNVHLLPALDYFDFVTLLSRCAMVITDSGGVQEEAPSLGVPVLVARQTTERPEGVAAGCARLVGSSPSEIVAQGRAILDEGRRVAAKNNPYGDGRAGERIAKAVTKFLRP